MKKLRLKGIKKLAKVTVCVSGMARNLNLDFSAKPFLLIIMICLVVFISSFSTCFYLGTILRDTSIVLEDIYLLEKNLFLLCKMLPFKDEFKCNLQ